MVFITVEIRGTSVGWILIATEKTRTLRGDKNPIPRQERPSMTMVPFP